MSAAVTEGIRVAVQSHYLEADSRPALGQFVFAYRVSIENQGAEPAQLVNRHWVVTHGDGRVEEVRGPGVVGEQPRLEPGASFVYTSGCVLDTPLGTMRGSYEMVRDDGSRFDAEIAEFVLATPGKQSDGLLN
jgi:ApaG protein